MLMVWKKKVFGIMGKELNGLSDILIYLYIFIYKNINIYYTIFL